MTSGMFQEGPVKKSEKDVPAFLEENRSWEAVDCFYQHVVCGEGSLEQIGLQSGDRYFYPGDQDASEQTITSSACLLGCAKGPGKTTRKDRNTYKMCINYWGPPLKAMHIKRA